MCFTISYFKSVYLTGYSGGQSNIHGWALSEEAIQSPNHERSALKGERHGFAVPVLCMTGAFRFILRFILCSMYIPRPAKLLFTVDDGWNRYLEKHGDSVSQWTQLAVERMLTCGTCAMGVR